MLQLSFITVTLKLTLADHQSNQVVRTSYLSCTMAHSLRLTSVGLAHAHSKYQYPILIPSDNTDSFTHINMFRERHCTGVVYNETVMLSRTFHQFDKQL